MATGTNFDVIIGGYKAKIKKGDRQGYNRRTTRREIQQNLIGQAEDVALLKSRVDGIGLYQTSWAGGAQWWKPLLSSAVDSYFQANHMDVWSEPGKIVPGNSHTDAANTDIHDNCVMATDGTNWYAIGDNNTTDAAERSVYKWTPGSDAWVRETTYSSGIQDDSDPLDMVYDSSDGYFYVLAETATNTREIGRFNPSTPAHDLSWFTHADNNSYGASIVVSEYGMFYTSGGIVFRIDKSGPSHVSVFDSGQVEILGLPTGSEVINIFPLLLSTPQGMYLIRNQVQQGQPIAFVYRIDRDTSGSYVGNPISTMPVGSVALSATFHLGQLLIATTPDYANYQDGEENLEVVIYYVGEGGKGALGSVLGNRDQIDETPYRFLGSEGSKVYLAGSKRLWVYDAVRGGLHTAWEWETAQANGGYMAMARAQDSDGDENLIFHAADRINRVKTTMTDDPDTVTNFGDDETHYTLESNYFDGGLPMELKELRKVEILHDAFDATPNQEWTVQFSADDGSFADALVTSTASAKYHAATLSGTTGRRFRYKLIYQTKDTERIPLRALLVTMASGEMVTEWDLYLDGDELLNVDNEVQDEQTFYDNMVTLGDSATITTLLDNMQEQAKETQTDATAISVLVQGVEIMKDKSGESMVHIVLREA